MANRYALQQVDIDILRQDSKDITIRIDILNSDDKVIDSIEGVCMSAPFSIDSGSDAMLTLSSNSSAGPCVLQAKHENTINAAKSNASTFFMVLPPMIVYIFYRAGKTNSFNPYV